MSVTINGSTGVTTPGISNSEGYTGDGLTIAAGAPSGAVQVDTSGNVGIGTSSPAYKLDVRAASGDVEAQIKADGAGSAANFRLVGSVAGYNNIRSMTGATEEWKIGSGAASGTMTFSISGSERMRIDSSGNLLVGTTNTTFSSGGIRLYANNSLEVVRDGGTSQSNVYLNKPNNNGDILSFNRAGTQVGVVSVTTTATTYGTSSDYRLKENIQPMTGALAKVAALKPVIYKWKIDGSDGEGFIAHELAEVVPQCVTGEKDAVEVVDVKDEDGNVIGTEERPVYQGIDTSFLVATLTAAIQELKAQVDAQAVEIAALKGQA